MRRFLLIFTIVVAAIPAWAKPAPELVAAIQDVFTPAVQNRSLVSSQLNLDMSKVRGYAVIKQHGIPAGQAYWFITRQDYEYRPYVIKNNVGKTYLGKVEITLEPGTIMVISNVALFQHTVQLRLLSKDVITEKGDKATRRDTRAATALTFKFHDLQMSAADAATILSKIEEYVAPADSLAQAEQISAQIRGSAPVTKAIPATKAEKAVATPPAKSSGVVLTGMNFDEVKHISGEPKRTTTRGNAVVFDYGDHEVIFLQEKVHDIRWK